MNEVYQNWIDTLGRIEKAAHSVGRDVDDIKIIAVSKNMSVDRIQMGIDAGIRILGENRVQEFLEKYDAIGNQAEWHFVGHLQSNKVKYVLDKVELIHSLDRFSLADEIEKRAERASKVSDVLVEVNAAGEKSKHGLGLDEALPFIRSVSENYFHIRINGLMTMAPYTENSE